MKPGAWEALDEETQEVLGSPAEWTRERAEQVACDRTISAQTRAALCELYPGLPYFTDDQVDNGDCQHTAEKIALERAEGPTLACVKVTIEAGHETGANLWAEAERILSSWSQVGLPSHPGGSDQVDFTIHYRDGHTYSGTYFLHHPRDISLADHMRRFNNTYSGRVRPDHITEAQWTVFVAHHPEEERIACSTMLDFYEIGDPR
jgi:hypothetical protein